MEVLLGLVSSPGCEELLPGLWPSPGGEAVWQLLALRSMYTHRRFLSSSSHGFLLYMSVLKFSHFIGHQSYWIRPHYSNMISS